MAVAAFVLGSRIVEKHFTLNRALKGTDHVFSLEPPGLRKMVRDLRRTQRGARRRDEDGASERGRAARRRWARSSSPPAICPPATCSSDGDLALKSPGDGLPPYELERVLGRDPAAAGASRTPR